MKQLGFTGAVFLTKDAGGMRNSVDPDQTAPLCLFVSTLFAWTISPIYILLFTALEEPDTALLFKCLARSVHNDK